MSSAESDRNVLFGMTAWRLGIVDREALMAAMYECTVAPSSSLAEVLKRMGKLSDRDRKRVEEALAASPGTAPHDPAGTLDEAGADPARTIETFDSAESLRSVLCDIVSGRPHATLAASDVVLASDKTVAGHQTLDEDSGDAANSSAGAATTPNGKSRFRILRPHARGGLGEVFVAMDEEVKREVALKQILPRQADNDTSRTRFMIEAEVTGSLEHPGVVPVYGLGKQIDGRPYYAMRFIRGMSLEDAIEQYHAAGFLPKSDPAARALELRNLLTRFVAVCNTIEYAHSRGIAHRDIKPENIMLGPYGETLVVDWGLARPFGDVHVHADSDDDSGVGSSISASTTNRPTQMGSIVGTPQFMSPEQAMGRLDLVGPASDVYSLGATLYCLLTDQAAFIAADVRKVLMDVQRGVFPPPRQVKRDVPIGLDAVCRKAMSLKPEDRYSAAKTLADDIEKWLADEPVSALPESRLQRWQRWTRRHKTWTRAAAVAIVAVATVAGTAYVREAGLRSDLQTALADEELARNEAEKARRRADENADIAKQEQLRAMAHAERAEQQSRLALATLKSVLFDIQAKLKNVPAAQTVRQSMLNTVIDGLKQAAGSLKNAPEADQSLVRAHLDLGDIFLDAGALDGGNATDLAEKEFAIAEELAGKRFAADATDNVARRDLGSAYQRLGDVSLRRGLPVRALPLLEKSLALRAAAGIERPDDAAVQRDLAATVQRLGLVNQEMGKLDAAEDFYLQFQAITKKLVDKHPGKSEHDRDLAVAHERLGDLRLSKGDVAEADEYFKQSLEVRRKLVEGAPENVVAVRDLSVTLDRLGELAAQRGDFPAAEDFYQQSLKLRKTLYEDDPNNMQSLRDLLVSYVQLGDISFRRDKLSEAEDYFLFNHEIAQQLAASDPANARFQSDLASSFDRLGKVSERKNQPKQALDHYRKRAAILGKLAKEDPTNLQWQRELSTGLFAVGDTSLLLGDLATARDSFAAYAELAKSRLAAKADDAQLQRTVSDACFRVGMVELRLGDTATAAKQLQASIDLAQKFVAAAPQDVSRRSFLANVETLMAQQAWQARNASAAGTWSDQAIEQVSTLRTQAAEKDRKQYDEWIAELTTLKTRCALAEKATADATLLEKQDPALLGDLLDFRITTLTAAKKYDEARAAVERLATLDARNGDYSFLAAKRSAQLAVVDPMNSEKQIERALALLTQAYDAGYFRSLENAARFEFAPELKSLQGKPAVQELLRKVRKDSKPDEGVKPGDAKVTTVRYGFSADLS
ncbi:MAG: tetratricopeptide repeat protein [Planctomycetia bacterium]|nr:tetratricopeptide repeat protein [Planctomycetia bacterium]